MALRRKIVAGKPTEENILITAELPASANFYRDYISTVFSGETGSTKHSKKSDEKRKKTAA